MNVLAVLGSRWGPPDLYLEASAAKLGVMIDARTPPDGDDLPLDETEHGGLIILGGPQSAAELDKHPFLRQCDQLIRDFHDANKPIVGICLGAQLIAASLGGRCYKGHISELGIHRVYPTRHAADDPLLPPMPDDGLLTLQFHSDTFDLPNGAVRLMRGDNYENQAFRMGASTYGFQSHFEISPPGLRTWLYEGPGARFLRGRPEVLAELDAKMELCGEVHERFTTTLAERWFAMVVERHRQGA
jgi:GMP synthase (glutamine-hydrolysing)